jgi:hypothetical protein
MQATPVAAGVQAENLTAEQWIARTARSIEFFRIDSQLRELQDMQPLQSAALNRARGRLLEWYRSRRAVLATELGL